MIAKRNKKKWRRIAVVIHHKIISQSFLMSACLTKSSAIVFISTKLAKRVLSSLLRTSRFLCFSNSIVYYSHRCCLPFSFDRVSCGAYTRIGINNEVVTFWFECEAVNANHSFVLFSLATPSEHASTFWGETKIVCTSERRANIHKHISNPDSAHQYAQ